MDPAWLDDMTGKPAVHWEANQIALLRNEALLPRKLAKKRTFKQNEEGCKSS